MGGTLSSSWTRSLHRAREKTLEGGCKVGESQWQLPRRPKARLCLFLSRHQDSELLDGHILVDITVILSSCQPSVL